MLRHRLPSVHNPVCFPNLMRNHARIFLVSIGNYLPSPQYSLKIELIFPNTSSFALTALSPQFCGSVPQLRGCYNTLRNLWNTSLQKHSKTACTWMCFEWMSGIWRRHHHGNHCRHHSLVPSSRKSWILSSWTSLDNVLLMLSLCTMLWHLHI